MGASLLPKEGVTGAHADCQPKQSLARLCDVQKWELLLLKLTPLGIPLGDGLPG